MEFGISLHRLVRVGEKAKTDVVVQMCRRHAAGWNAVHVGFEDFRTDREILDAGCLMQIACGDGPDVRLAIAMPAGRLLRIV